MLFYFNQYSALLLIGFTQGLVFFAILLNRGLKEERYSDKLLAVLLMLCCIYIAQYMLGFAHWYDSHDWHSTFLFYFPFHMLIFIGPVMYFYFRSLTNRNFKINKKHWWHWLPGMIVLAVYLIAFVYDVVWQHWINGEVFPDHFETKGIGAGMRQDYLPSQALGVLSTLVYTIMTILEYRRYRRYLYDNFSETEGLEFNWLRVLLYAIILGFTINWAVEAISMVVDISYQQYWVSYLGTAALIYFLSVQGFITGTKLRDQLQYDPLEQDRNLTLKDQAELDIRKEKLLTHMNTQKPYLEPRLTLNDLAKQLSIPSATLSKVINTRLGENFNDFVNQYRVAAVKENLENGSLSHLSLLGVAQECGFNSKATFNRTFKKFTGQTPSEFANRS